MEPTATATAPALRNDPITFEVLRNAFKAICNEASALIERVSYAPTITEGHDYSVSILTPDGRLVSHGQKDQAAHLGTFEDSLRAVIEFFPAPRPGDVHVLNVDGPAFDLLTTMSKFLVQGMELNALVAAVTQAPANAIRRPSLGTLAVGTEGDATIVDRGANGALRFAVVSTVTEAAVAEVGPQVDEGFGQRIQHSNMMCKDDDFAAGVRVELGEHELHRWFDLGFSQFTPDGADRARLVDNVLQGIVIELVELRIDGRGWGVQCQRV